MKKMIKKLLIIMIIIIINIMTFCNIKNYANYTMEAEEYTKLSAASISTQPSLEKWFQYYNDGVVDNKFYDWMVSKNQTGELWQMYVMLEQKIDGKTYWIFYQDYNKDEIDGELVFADSKGELSMDSFNLFKKEVKAAFDICNFETKLKLIMNKTNELTDKEIKGIKENLNAGINGYKLYYEDGSGKYNEWRTYIDNRYEEIKQEEAKAEKDNSGVGDITQDVDYWKPGQSGDNTKINNITNLILSLIRTAGIFIALGSLMVIGIKYMLGSLEEKAHYKQIMLPWIIGAIMVFAVTFLPKLIYDLAQNI